MQSASRFQSTLHPSYLALSLRSPSSDGPFLRPAGVRMSTPSQRAAIRQSVWRRRRSKKGLALSPPPRRVSPLRSLSSCSSTPAAFWLHSTRARRECMHSKFQFYHMERMRNFEILKSQNCGKVCLPIRISGSARPARRVFYCFQ